jgi:ATP-dependent RNA helicase RhlE
MSFRNFNLAQPILRALQEKGYETPTPIQAQAIPEIIRGKDVLGCAQTGTGKTAAFCIPILERLEMSKSSSGVRAVILSPTRELAQQIGDNLTYYGKHLSLRNVLIYGGVSQYNQVQQLRKGVDIIVATPGRLLDLINQGHVRLSKVEILVLDEADRMLDMGFINDIRKIIATTPAARQTLFFSATMPSEIQTLVASILKNPVKIQIAPVTSTAENVHQSVYFVERGNKRALLRHLITEQKMENVLVFTKTKHGADKIALDLNRSGIVAESFHGNKTQGARQRALNNFKRKTTRVLVATDIAARGIDISDLPFVVNYELPQTSDTYIHRIGRTGRAGAKGSALSFVDNEERAQLRDINRITNRKIEVIEEHPYLSAAIPSSDRVASPARREGQQTPRYRQAGARSGARPEGPRRRR